jgi:hypothetical protein
MQPRSNWGAWKSHEEIRQCFKVLFDMSSEPPRETGYVCKFCSQWFDSGDGLFELTNHAAMHRMNYNFPYATPRFAAITGEQVFDLHAQIAEAFEFAYPVVGTWKFDCKSCGRRFPHRTSACELAIHAKHCSSSLASRPERVN